MARNMAALMRRPCLQLFESITPRVTVFMSRKCFLHVDPETGPAVKPQNSTKTVGVLPKKNAKFRDLEPPLAASAKQVDRKKQTTTQDLLEDIGVKVKKLNAKIDVKKLSFAKVKSILSFLEEIGIDGKDRGKIVARRPGILTAKEYLLRTRVQTMRDVGIKPDSVAYVVQESPGVLTARTEESLPAKITFFENLKVKPKFTTDEILHVLTKCPHIIASYTVESLEEKVQFFENELKFNKHHIKNLILKQPSILTFSKEAILEKYNYCYEKFNVGRSDIARCPRVFQCSLKRIKERREFLKHLGRITEEMRIDDYGLGLIVTTPNKQFVEQVAKSTLDEFDQFKKDMVSIIRASEEGDSKHVHLKAELNEETESGGN